MRPSWRLACHNFGARRGRTVLLTSAVVLAASLVVAVTCAISSSQSSLDHRINEFIGAADVRIIHPGNGRFPDDVLASARAWPGVTVAAGRLGGAVSLVHPDRRTDPATGRLRRVVPTAVGVEFDLEPRIRARAMESGVYPSAPDEVLLDPHTAEALDVGVGELLEISRFEASIPVRVAGIYKRQKLSVLQRPRVYLDRRVLGEATDHAEELTSIYIMLDEGVDPAVFCAAYGDAVPEPLVLEPAELVRSGFDQRVEANRIGMRFVIVLTFMCTGLIILVGLTTGVTERQREMALLRCVGAGRGHLFGAQILVGLFFGLIGAAVGVPLGVALTAILVEVFREYIPSGLVLDPAGLAQAVAGSIAAGLIGALVPAVQAARVTPLRAMATTAAPPRPAGIGLCGLVALALIGLQVGLSAIEDDDTRFWTYAWVGLPCLVLGWFLLAVPVIVAVTRLAAGPISRALRLPADMLRGSVAATPYRNGFTAGALMVGLAILVETWAAGGALKRDWVDRIKFADGFATQVPGMSPEHQRAIADLPFVTEVCPIGYLPVRLIDRQVFGLAGITPSNVICVGFDPDRFFSMNAVEWVQGDPEQAIAELRTGDAAIVAKRFLVAKGVGVGDRLTLGVGRRVREFRIVGVVSSAGLDVATQLFGIRSQYTEYAMSCVFVDFATVADVFDNPNAYMLQVNLTDDVTDDEARVAIEDAAPGATFASGRWIADTVRSIVDALLMIHTVVGFAALLLAAFAVGSVVAANIQGRRFELGVLRAIGAGRGVILRLVLGEAVLLSLAAGVVGTGLGLQAAWVDAMNMRDLGGLPVGIAVPAGAIAGSWAIVLVLTMLFSLPPALRAARTPPAMLVAAGRNE